MKLTLFLLGSYLLTFGTGTPLTPSSDEGVSNEDDLFGEGEDWDQYKPRLLTCADVYSKMSKVGETARGKAKRHSYVRFGNMTGYPVRMSNDCRLKFINTGKMGFVIMGETSNHTSPCKGRCTNGKCKNSKGKKTPCVNFEKGESGKWCGRWASNYGNRARCHTSNGDETAFYPVVQMTEGENKGLYMCYPGLHLNGKPVTDYYLKEEAVRC